MGEEVTRIINALTTLKDFPVEKIILFGSRAREDAFIYSDYDFIVVSPAFAAYPFPDRASKILKYLPLAGKLDLLCYTPEEFTLKSKQIGIVQEAIKEGKHWPTSIRK